MPPFAEWIKELWVLIQLWSVLQFLFLFGGAWGVARTVNDDKELGYSFSLSGVTEIPAVSMYEEGLGWTEVTLVNQDLTCLKSYHWEKSNWRMKLGS